MGGLGEGACFLCARARVYCHGTTNVRRCHIGESSIRFVFISIYFSFTSITSALKLLGCSRVFARRACVCVACVLPLWVWGTARLLLVVRVFSHHNKSTTNRRTLNEEALMSSSNSEWSFGWGRTGRVGEGQVEFVSRCLNGFILCIVSCRNISASRFSRSVGSLWCRFGSVCFGACLCRVARG